MDVPLLSDRPPSSTTSADVKASRLGLVLFVIYLLFYGGFVLLNAFKADWMETIVLAGLNLAIVYGFALILVAIGMALIYGLFGNASSETQSGADE